jgi:hypothetical protein
VHHHDDVGVCGGVHKLLSPSVSNYNMMRSFGYCRRLVQPRDMRFSTVASPAISEPIASTPPKSTLLNSQSMTPKEVVNYLDNYIIGQGDAKKAVAIAFRNRWRRQHLPIDIKNEVLSHPRYFIGHRSYNVCQFRSFLKTF